MMHKSQGKGTHLAQFERHFFGIVYFGSEFLEKLEKKIEFMCKIILWDNAWLKMNFENNEIQTWA